MKAVIQTYSGRMLDLLNPDPALITLDDIAHGLALKNRFNGMTIAPYSVAQHCVLGARHIGMTEDPARRADRQLAFLIHELDEVFLPDIAGPLKPFVSVLGEPWNARLSRLHKRACRKALGIPNGIAEEGEDTDRMDKVMLATERRDLLVPVEAHEWAWLPSPIAGRGITPWSDVVAEDEFVLMFRYLMNEVGL